MEKGQLTRTQQYAERVKKIQEKFQIEDKMSANLQSMAQQSLKGDTANGSQTTAAGKPGQNTGTSNNGITESSTLFSSLANSILSASALLSSLSTNPEYNLLNKKEKKKLRKKLKKKEKKEKKKGDNSNNYVDSSQASQSDLGAAAPQQEPPESELTKVVDLAAMVEKEAQINAAAEALKEKRKFRPVRSITAEAEKSKKEKKENFYKETNYAFTCIDFETPNLESLKNKSASAKGEK